jgi:hypothetical protein
MSAVSVNAQSNLPGPERGWGPLFCPCCAVEATIRLDRDDLDTLTCADCDESFGLERVRGMIGTWARVLRWLDGAPGR